MDIQTLTTFFMWCTIINVALFAWALLWFILAPGFVFRMQTRLFPLPRQTYDAIVYSFLGGFKLLIIVFNVTPWLTLLILA